MTLGTPEQPLRIAIIGSGPSGFYAAEYLQKQKELTVEIDMFDRLPTPFGLVRGGVAPDHQKIKSVTKVYDKIAAHPGFRFYGHVTFGTDLTREDINRHYHAVIYATGAQTDKNLGVPGEDLPGSHAATEFVGWYNGHPDYRDLQFDLSQETAVVVGVGNVAMDVTRILARSQDELMETDIADHALRALAQSKVKTIYVLGRRGPAQAKFTNPEIKELGEMSEAEVVIDPAELALDPISQAYIDSEVADKKDVRNIEIMRELAARDSQGKPKRIIFRFLTSPVEIIGRECVEAVKIVKNELVQRDNGSIGPRATEDFETIPAGLVFRSVGYMGVPLAGVPFHERWGVIPNHQGRVLTVVDGEPVPGDYVVGWIKRGPSGIIGTNKPDSVETAKLLLEDYEAGKLLKPEDPTRAAVEALLKERGVHVVTYADWQRLDALEQARGEEAGRPRVKFCTVEEMMSALRE